MRAIRFVLPLAAALLCLAPAGALAAVPKATTGKASGVSPNAATIAGTVNPGGRVTTWYFQYGKTKNYGARTTAQDAGSGTKGVGVSSTLTGLTPKTTYHYRLVATSSAGTARGADRTFKTPEAPTVSTIAVSPNPVTFGKSVVVSGFLVGPRGGGGKQVALEISPFPFTSPFTQFGNAVVTTPTGAYQFAAPGLATMRMIVEDRTDRSIVSPVWTEKVAAAVTLKIKPGNRKRVLRVSGRVRPHGAAKAVVLQRRVKGGWKKVLVAHLHNKSGAQSDTFARRTRRHAGRYRVITRGANGYVEGISGSVKVKKR